MASYVKAMSYAMLDKYQECRDIMTQYDDLKSELVNIDTLEGNRKGEYNSEHNDTYRYDQLHNYANGIEIKMTQDGRGRGVFATKDFKKGDLIIVDKAIA